MAGNLSRDVSDETIRSSPREASVEPPASPATRRSPLIAIVMVMVIVTLAVIVAVIVTTRNDDVPVPDPPSTTEAPSPSASSSTTSEPGTPENAAIASAEAVYREYLRVSDVITTAGTGDVAALETVAIGEALSQAQVAAQNYQLAGIRRVGAVQIASLSTTAVTLDSAPPEVVLDACLNLSETDLVGPDGESVTSPDDPDRAAATVFVRDYPNRGGWLVASIAAEGQPC